MLPPSLENQDSAGSERGSYHKGSGRKSSLASQQSFARRESSFAQESFQEGSGPRHTLLSCDTDFLDDRGKSDITHLQMFA